MNILLTVTGEEDIKTSSSSIFFTVNTHSHTRKVSWTSNDLSLPKGDERKFITLFSKLIKQITFFENSFIYFVNSELGYTKHTK